MAELVYDANTNTISLVNRQGVSVGSWEAHNIVTSGSRHLRFVPNGTYAPIDRNAPHRHNRTDDSVTGKYGSYGTIRLPEIQGHTGIAVHSGRAGVRDRAGRSGPKHATEGCIRTTDDAMRAISSAIQNDPLQTITVRNNHAQR